MEYQSKLGIGVVQVVSLVALLLAWVYIFDTVQKEVDVLTHPQEGIMGVGPRPDLEAGALRLSF